MLEAGTHTGHRPAPAAECGSRPASAPRLIALATAVPPGIMPQAEARRRMAALFGPALGPDRRLLQVFDHAEIDRRHVCAPPEWYSVDHGFAEKNALYVEHALGLAAEAVSRVLGRAGLGPGSIDHIVFVSSTGLATPSVDARLANRLDFRADVRRTPIWGLGCAGGAAGLARAADFARADPAARVLLVALELCTLTFQFADRSKRNLVAASLFGDGAAAAIVAGPAARTAPDLPAAAPARAESAPQRPLAFVGARSTLWKDTEEVMGWTVNGAGLSVVFSRDIPAIVRAEVRPSLEPFLAAHGLALGDVRHMVTHPGGVKVLRAWAEALDLPAGAFAHARDVLRDYGNMSSPSCLFVLERFLAAGDIGPGEHALVAALGPGFAAEYVLLRGLAT